MSEKDTFKTKLDKAVKVFEEKHGDLAKFALMETSFDKPHKLLRKRDFLLPREVLDELRQLESADLYDLERSDGDKQR